MIRRMFPNDPPRITFTKDFHQLVHGTLLPGRAVTIVYDADRLPHERSEYNGQKAWSIQAFYKFIENGEVRVAELWSETGTVLTKLSNDPGEGTMMMCRIDVPADADHLTIWFLNTGRSGADYWDSNYGANYIFRFVVEDLQLDFAEVAHGSFRIELTASSEVSDLAVLYRIMNDPSAIREVDTRQPLTASEPDGAGNRRWSGSAAVPENAVVRFTLAYTAYGNPHADTNSGKGYLTWSGAKADPQAGVV
ncbi:MAG TPA: DUF6209 family protein [Bryobacteraceae bacterium]|nr:DUF6209 family protein [Bryobacteraceae bacterium]